MAPNSLLRFQDGGWVAARTHADKKVRISCARQCGDGDEELHGGEGSVGEQRSEDQQALGRAPGMGYKGGDEKMKKGWSNPNQTVLMKYSPSAELLRI